MSSVLPPKPSLEQLKKQAKDLFAAHADRSPTCLSVLRHLHRFKDSPDQAVFTATLKLADIQFALAMEYGFTTWDELVRHLESRNLGLGESAARAWARLRNNAEFARIIGGESRSVVEGSMGPFPCLEVESAQARFIVEEAAPGEAANRLVRQQRMGEFLNMCGVQAPRITLLEVAGMTFGVHRKLEGVRLDSVELSPADQDTFVSQMAGLLDRLHSVPLPEACRILGLPALSPEEAAREYRFGGYLEVDVIEGALARELEADKVLKDVWHETRGWITTFVSTPADLVFGHGDLWLPDTLVAKTSEGYRLSGVTLLYNAGLVNLYDEFLRVGGLGLYDGEGEPIGRAVIEAYNRLPGRTRRVEEVPLRHAITAFWFYLAHENTGESRLNLLASAKRTQRGR